MKTIILTVSNYLIASEIVNRELYHTWQTHGLGWGQQIEGSVNKLVSLEKNDSFLVRIKI